MAESEGSEGYESAILDSSDDDDFAAIIGDDWDVGVDDDEDADHLDYESDVDSVFSEFLSDYECDDTAVYTHLAIQRIWRTSTSGGGSGGVDADVDQVSTATTTTFFSDAGENNNGETDLSFVAEALVEFECVQSPKVVSKPPPQKPQPPVTVVTRPMAAKRKLVATSSSSPESKRGRYSLSTLCKAFQHF